MIYTISNRVLDGNDRDDQVARVLEFQRRRHREHCTDCDCVETVKVSTIEILSYVDDVAGGPLGVSRSALPMVETTYRRPRERT